VPPSESLPNVRRLFAVAAIVVTAAVLLIVSGRPSVWNSMRPATCLPADCFCEAVRDQLVRQPVNALSGLSFVGVGLFVLPRRRRQHDSMPSGSDGKRLAGYLFAAAAVVVGVGTVLYHASLTFVGQTLDVFGMYLLVTMIGLSILTRRWSLSATMTVGLGIVINTLLLVLLIAAPEHRRSVFAGLVVLVIALESSASPHRERGGRQAFWLAAAILAGGFVVWALDYSRVVCSPMSWFQGHAVWHLCGAAAVGFTMRYYAGHERQMTA
jgi:hypothetical protein